MGLLKEIDQQICRPCRRRMDELQPGERHHCDGTCALALLWDSLDNIKIEGRIKDIVKLRAEL